MIKVVDKVVDDADGVDNLKIAIAERIKTARKALEVTQKELCAQIDMPLPSLRNYETAKQIPGGEAIIGFLRAGINGNWLLTGKGQMLWHDSLEEARRKRSTKIIDEARWAITNYALKNVPNHWFVTSVAEPDQALNKVVDDYNAGRIFNGDEALRKRIPSISIEDLADWGREVIAWKDRLKLGSASSSINKDALVQAICVTFQTAPSGDTVEKSAKKAVSFYQYCIDQGLITQDGEGSGNLDDVV